MRLAVRRIAINSWGAAQALISFYNMLKTGYLFTWPNCVLVFHCANSYKRWSISRKDSFFHQVYPNKYRTNYSVCTNHWLNYCIKHTWLGVAFLASVLGSLWSLSNYAIHRLSPPLTNFGGLVFTLFKFSCFINSSY